MPDLQVKLTKAGGTRTFDVEGEWTWRQEPVYKDAANPPALVELREVWEIRGALLRSSDGTINTGWTAFQGLRSDWEARANYTKVEIVRDPSGSPEVELTLGPSSYEEFRIEEVSGEPDPNNPAASYRTIFPVTIRFSAVRKFADTNGIVDWDQTVRNSWQAGLRVLEWVTTITTREGTSAVTKAKSYAGISVGSLGGTFTFETNGPDGINYEILDADEENSRTPTRVRAVSRVRQWGVNVGTTTPGNAPDSVSLVDEDRKIEDRRERVRTASATGPGAESFCRSRAPSWAQDVLVREDKATKTYLIEWRAVEERDDDEDEGGVEGPNRLTMRGTISGGRRRVRFLPVTGGLPPIQQTGPLLPVRLDLEIRLRKRGGEGKRDELKLPAELGDPWVLDMENSQEGEPYREERGAQPEGDLWAREARLVYWSAALPTESPLAKLRRQAGTGVATYLSEEATGA